MDDPGAVLRALHHAPGAFIMPNPWDAGTARILAVLGFRALATTSAGMAFSLGVREGQVAQADTLRFSADAIGFAELERHFPEP